jgi:hypothetical protein
MLRQNDQRAFLNGRPLSNMLPGGKDEAANTEAMMLPAAASLPPAKNCASEPAEAVVALKRG